MQEALYVGFRDKYFVIVTKSPEIQVLHAFVLVHECHGFLCMVYKMVLSVHSDKPQQSIQSRYRLSFYLEYVFSAHTIEQKGNLTMISFSLLSMNHSS